MEKVLVTASAIFGPVSLSSCGYISSTTRDFTVNGWEKVSGFLNVDVDVVDHSCLIFLGNF